MASKKRTDEENTRVVGSAVGGAILGASFGGPLGAIIGGVLGVALGESVNDKKSRGETGNRRDTLSEGKKRG